MSNISGKVLLLVMASLGAQFAYADECDAILEQGVRNTYQQLDKRDLKTGFSNAMCSSSSNLSNSNQGGGLGLSLPINGVPIGLNANYDQAQYNSIKSSTCSSNQGSLSDDNFHAVLSMVADARIIDAWSQCKVQGGTFLNASANGNLVVFELKFRAIGNVTSTKVTLTPQFIGVACPSPVITKGLKVTGSTLLQACVREGTGEVTALVNTEQNGVRVFVPAILPPQQPVLTAPLTIPPIRTPVLAACLIPVANMPPGSFPGLQANCEFFGPVGQPCQCPVFDGHGGVLSQLAGTSTPPNDTWWTNLSPRHPGFERAK
jgi:hypothetical protein